MNEKIASLLLICLVTLSIAYVCNSPALPSDATESIDAMPSITTAVAEEPSQKVKPFFLQADPVGDPKPH